MTDLSDMTVCLITFNRTSLELKLDVETGLAKMDVVFNRTSLELKHLNNILSDRVLFTFNRTSLELKQVGSSNHISPMWKLLIEPVWN